MRRQPEPGRTEPPTATRASGSAPRPPEPPLSARAVVIGTVLLALLLGLAAWWAVRRGDALAAERAAPALEMLEPADGDAVSGPVRIVFAVDSPLRRGPTGWGTGGFHIHAQVDGRELMPGARDIAGLGAGRYAWTLPGLPPGTRSLRLFWSDARHREIQGSGTPEIRLHAGSGEDSGFRIQGFR